MGGDDIRITLSGQAAQQLRKAFPTGHLSISRKAEKIIVQWLEEKADKAQDEADGKEALKRLKALRSGKEKAVPADEVYARLGI